MVIEAGLAAGAVAALVPYAQMFGETAVEKLGEAVPKAVGELYALVKGKLTARGEAKALERVEAEPNDADSQAGLRLAVKDAVAEDADFAATLSALLKALPKADAGDQLAHVGDNSRLIQQRGSGNTATISGGD